MFQREAATVLQPWQILVAALAGRISRHQDAVICRSMGSRRISSASDAICCEQPITEYCGLVRGNGDASSLPPGTNGPVEGLG
jgi:hypothetical protein